MASIRPIAEFKFQRPVLSTLPGGRFVATNVSVRDLITYAYGLQRFDVVEGGPSWAESDRFDVAAVVRTDRNAASDPVVDMPALVQRLLADRFAVRLRREMRTGKGHQLVLARANGTLGPQLRRSTLDCVALTAARMARIADGQDPATPENRSGQCNITTTNGRTVAEGHTMAQLAMSLSTRMQAPVVDRTGLQGPFSIELRAMPAVALSAQVDASSTYADYPGIDVALREQLGLRLEPHAVDVTVLVIEHLERPTEN